MSFCYLISVMNTFYKYTNNKTLCWDRYITHFVTYLIAETWGVLVDWHEFVLGKSQMNFHVSDTEKENKKSLLNEKIKTMVQKLPTLDEIYFLRRWWFSYTKQVPGYWTQMLIIWCGNIVGSLSKHRTNALASWNEKRVIRLTIVFDFTAICFALKILSLSATNTHTLISLFKVSLLFSVTFCYIKLHRIISIVDFHKYLVPMTMTSY